MKRTQISLSEEGRRVLDAEAARTGRSIAALIRDAVEATYGIGRSADDDLAAMEQAFGAWGKNELDGADWADQMRPARRLEQAL